MAPIPATVQLLSRNSAKSIGACLESLRDFDEVIVQDGYSTDGTREIVKQFPNARILDQDKRFLDTDGRITDFASMRNESIRAAKHDWLFVVDADEVTKPELVAEVRSIVERNVPGVYEAFRRFYLHGKPVMFCSGYPVLQIRLFHRSTVEGYVKPVHERLNLKPGVTKQLLKQELPVPLQPAHELTAKYDRYLKMEAKRLGVISWGRWFKWVFLRNLKTIIGLTLKTFWLRVIPKPGLRMPLVYEFQYIRHSWRTMWATCPLIARRSTTP